jgi:acetaldehyde dehydrogenase
MAKVAAAIVGSGNIGTDLLFKLQRSDVIEVRWMVGVDPQSDGLRLARSQGVQTMAGGVAQLLASDPLPGIVFEATSAAVHRVNAPLYATAGIRAVDLTPAAVGPFAVPTVTVDLVRAAPNVNMTSCGGQATIPMVAAVSSVCDVGYAEIVSSIASKSAGPGTRANIDEFTRTTARGLEVVGGAKRGKAIIILNPIEPPMLMRATVFCAIPPDSDLGAIGEAVTAMSRRVQEFVPGYRLHAEPQFDDAEERWGGSARVTILIEVEGSGDYLPRYAGNLDIMTSAATRVGELMAAELAAEVAA